MYHGAHRVGLLAVRQEFTESAGCVATLLAAALLIGVDLGLLSQAERSDKPAAGADRFAAPPMPYSVHSSSRSRATSVFSVTLP